jgi:hypothetical protein
LEWILSREEREKQRERDKTRGIASWGVSIEGEPRTGSSHICHESKG